MFKLNKKGFGMSSMLIAIVVLIIFIITCSIVAYYSGLGNDSPESIYDNEEANWLIMNDIIYNDVSKLLLKILPDRFDKCVFSLLLRKCNVNGKDTISKEFQCKCVNKNSDKILDLVKFSDGYFDVEDILFAIMDKFYDLYNKLNDFNFIIFKLKSDGSYDVRFFNNIDNNCDNLIISNIVERFLLS